MCWRSRHANLHLRVSQQFRGHSASIYATAVSPDGALVATGGGDDVAMIWSLASPSPAAVAVLRGHTDSVVAIAWNHVGTMLATASLDSTVRIWDRAGALLHCIEGPSAEIEWLSWHPKGDVLLAGRQVAARAGTCGLALGVTAMLPPRRSSAATTRRRGCGT